MQAEPSITTVVTNNAVVQVGLLKAVTILIVQVEWLSEHGVGGDIVHGAAGTNVCSWMDMRTKSFEKEMETYSMQCVRNLRTGAELRYRSWGRIP